LDWAGPEASAGPSLTTDAVVVATGLVDGEFESAWGRTPTVAAVRLRSFAPEQCPAELGAAPDRGGRRGFQDS